MSKSALENAIGEYFAESEEILQRVTMALTQMEGAGDSQEILDSIYRDIHTLKGSSQLFGFSNVGVIAHGLEASLEPVRQRRSNLYPAFVDAIFACLDLISRVIKDPSLDLEKKPELTNEMTVLLPKLFELATSNFEVATVLKKAVFPIDDSEKGPELEQRTVEPLIKNPAPQSRPSLELNKPTEEKLPLQAKPMNEKISEEQSSESNSIRVQVTLLDKLMNLVGEMVLTRNQVLQHARISEDNEFQKLTQRLDLVTTELQDNVMKTRMQPIGSVFSKFQRVVRDLCRDLGKSIELHIVGAETELDKSLIEAIKDPLTHIVRNACDHGIESPQVRRANQKPEQGKISLKAYHEGGQMIIEIQDDGGGLDPSKIREKALQKQVISPEKAKSLTDKQAQELIFMPGFSTAEQVSAVSGRGVGMDVVKTNILKIGGVVELESVPKQYTRILLRIPLTLAIVPAMIVSSENESYAIPQVKLQELLRVDLDEGGKIERLHGQPVYRLRDQLLPLVSCKKIMSDKDDLAQSVFNIAVLKSTTQVFGLLVDEVKDTADIVVKPLPTFLKKVDMFSGATIMGDGSVALIVDTQGIFDRALGVRKENQVNKLDVVDDSIFENVKQSVVTEYLLVRISDATYAIPLVLVHRLEEFNRDSIDHSGEESLVKYRDGLLPLLNVGKILGIKENPELEKKQLSPVVVISKANRLFGLTVDEIIDISQTDQDIIAHIKPKEGLLGTVISPQGSVLTIIDTYAVINKATGNEMQAPKKVSKKGKVLLAEDTLFFVKQISKVLKEAGLEVDHAPDGEAAHSLLMEKGPDYYQMVVSDIEMPKMNGYELAHKIRQNELFNKLPLLALTTRFKEVDQKRGMESGFDRYLEKLQSDILIDNINSLLGAKK